MKALAIAFFLFFCFIAPVHAQVLNPFNEPSLPVDPYAAPVSPTVPGFCIHTYDVLDTAGMINTCKNISIIALGTSNPSITPEQSGLHSCWYYSFNRLGYDSVSPVLKLNSQYEFSMAPPPLADFSQPCKPKGSIPPSQCSVDIQNVVQQAFSNKFPLDLFQNYSSVAPSASCPLMVVLDQTFQLCYLNKLVASLKYVLLLVFIISSVLAL